MGNSSNVQSNFLGGEWSKTAQGRADKQEYKTAMARALNVIPVPPGAAARRPGFRQAAFTRNGAAARLIDYNFQESAPYNLELTNSFARFFSGATPVRTNDDQVVTAISSANPAAVSTTTAHNWNNNDRVRFLNFGINNPLLHNREFAITTTSTTAFTLADAITGDAIDGATLGTFISGSVGRVLELLAPYSADQLPNVRAVQINEDFDTNLILLNDGVMPQKISVDVEPTDEDFAEFSIDPILFEDGPYLDHYKNSQVTPSGTTGVISLSFDFKPYSATVAYNTGDYVTSSAVTYRSLVDQNQNNAPASSPTLWEVADATTFINNGLGLKTSDVGRHIRLYSQTTLWAAGTTYAAGDVRVYNDVTYTSLQASNTGKTPDAQPTWWSITPSAAIWTWGKITSVTGSVSVQISQSAGSVFGNMTNNGAAFDGTTVQTQANCASKSGGTSAVGYVGKNFSGGPKAVVNAVVFAPSNTGIFASSATTTGLLRLYGSQTLPANSTDGTLLATTSVTTFAAGTSATLVSTDQVTEWKYLWIDAASSFNATTTTVAIAEVQFYNSVNDGASTGCSIQIMGDVLLYTTVIRDWRLGLYSDTTGWPRCGTGHDGRLFLAGPAKNRFDASSSNKPFNFAPTEPDGSVVGSNAFSYTFNADKANSIYWLHSERQGVLCGTDGGEWLIQASANSNPLTPTTVQAAKSTRIKCADIEPATCDNSLLIVQRYKRKIMEYFADVNAGKFTAPNLSEYAKHMLKDGAAQVVYQREAYPIVWVRTETGELRGMTYKRESMISSAPPDFFGWHRHELGSEFTITSMCVGPSIDEATDTLAIIAYDAVTELHHVEYLTEIVAEDIPITDGWYLDNSVAPSAYVVAPTMVTLYGLWHLNDKEVSVLAGGLDMGEYTVTDGAIVLEIGTPAGFTLPYVQGFGGVMPIVVGFKYTSQGQTLRPISMADTGAQAGPAFGKIKRNHKYAALLESAKDISFGQTFEKMQAAKLETSGGTPLTTLQLKSGVHVGEIDGAQELDGMLCWECSGPFPGTVTMLGGFIQTADK